MNDLIVNLNANSAQRGDRWVKLSASEAEFATILHRAEGRPVSRKAILRGLYGILAKGKSEQIVINLAKQIRRKFTHLGATIEGGENCYWLVVAEERS